MRQVYEPANAAEAHMLAHLLQQEGIEAHVSGEALQGAAGELPAGGVIGLLVPDENYERARALLLHWEKSNLAEPTERPGRRFGIVAALVFLLVGGLTGWVAKVAYDNTEFTYGDGITALDQNDDGRDDVTWYYRLGSTMAHKAEYDNNHDGISDTVMYFDELGVPTEERWDVDFDGEFDSRSWFRGGIRERSEVDTDGNGVPDVRSTYQDGNSIRDEWTDHTFGHVVRIDHYGAFRLERSELDLDRDGFLETVRYYDRFLEVTRTETRTPR